MERRKVPLPHLLWHWKATKYLYLTSSETGELPSTSTSPLVALEFHEVPLPHL